MDIDKIIVRLKQLRQEGYEKYITVNGARIRYTVIGAGPVVVLLHGLGGFLETWGLNMVPLSDHYKVYALDLPGHGLSAKLDGCYIPDCATGFLVSILDRLGIQRATLIGHSLGGAISINTAADLIRLINLSLFLPLVYLKKCPHPTGFSQYHYWAN